MNFFDFSFWQNFGSNLLATVVGVALGIPIAFWINRRVKDITDKEKRTKIATSLARELDVNRSFLENWLDRLREEDQNFGLSAIWLDDDVWKALSDGGDLQWVKDPFLVGRIARAYGAIGHVKYIANICLLRSKLGETDHSFYLSLIHGIHQGIESIEQALEKLGDYGPTRLF